jgi:natural product precursor
MKKLSLEMLRLTSEEVLERNQMAKITGGGYWRCSCSSSSPQFTVMANDDIEATQVAAAECGYGGYCTEIQQ